MTETVVAASSLARSELMAVFNAGYSDYVVPLQVDEPAFAEHLEIHDVDLDASRVVIDAEPVAIALVARRDASGWVAGVGTEPGHRRRGLAARALLAALEIVRERGVRHVDLEVIDVNTGARALYERLGFTLVRDLLVWALPVTGDGPADARHVGREVPLEAAQTWIDAHARGHAPWQRAPGTAQALHDRGVPIRATIVDAGDEPAAAATWHEQNGRAVVLGIAARDRAAATALLRALTGEHRQLRLTNVQADDPASQALEAMGGRLIARQHEMRIAV